MRARTLICGLSVALVAASGTSAPAQAAAQNGGVRTWSPISERSAELGTVTRERALTVARSFNVVTALRETFQGHVQAMKAENPDLTILVYTNAMFAQSGQGSTFPASYYMYDAQGQKVRTTHYGNYMMNPYSLEGGDSGQSWANERYRQCRNALAESGYDGCFLDVLGNAPLKKGYTTSTPVNPRTGRAWTNDDYLAATSGLAAKIRDLLEAGGLGHVPVYGNGLGSGPRFYSGGAKVLLPALDAGIAESWMRTGPSSITAWPTEAQWKQNVDMLKEGKILVSVKTFTNATKAQRQQWHKYALASFLLGADSADSFNFIGSETSDYTVASKYWSTRLGQASAPYAKSGSTYVRSFASGKAVVNVTGSTQTYRLGSRHCGLTGFAGATITLPAHSGDVLRKC